MERPEILETLCKCRFCRALFLAQVRKHFWPKLSEGSVGRPLVYTTHNDAMTCCNLNPLDIFYWDSVCAGAWVCWVTDHFHRSFAHHIYLIRSIGINSSTADPVLKIMHKLYYGCEGDPTRKVKLASLNVSLVKNVVAGYG